MLCIYALRATSTPIILLTEALAKTLKPTICQNAYPQKYLQRSLWAKKRYFLRYLLRLQPPMRPQFQQRYARNTNTEDEVLVLS